MDAYRDLGNVGVTTRRAATLAGVSRATATRPVPPVLLPAAPTAPANQLSAAERARVLTVLTEARFVDATPVQIYAQLATRSRAGPSMRTARTLVVEGQLVLS